MPRPTEAEIIAAMETFAPEPKLKRIAERRKGDNYPRINGVLNQPPAAIEVEELSTAVVWLVDNWEGLSTGERNATRARLQVLRVSVPASDAVNQYLHLMMSRHENIGDDLDTAMTRLGVVLALAAGAVDPDELDVLLKRERDNPVVV